MPSQNELLLESLMHNFAVAVIADDGQRIFELLHPEGEFQFVNSEFETLKTDSIGYTSWLLKRVEEAKPWMKLEYEMDRCLQCTGAGG